MSMSPRGPGADEPAARYHRTQLALGILGYLVGAAYLGLVLATDAAAVLARSFASWPWWIQVPAIAGVLAAGHRALVAPLAWLRGWSLPRRHGLLHQPLGAWLRDRVKAAALGALLALAGVELVYAVLRAWPAWWWLLAAVTVVASSVVIAIVLPIWIVPMFYQLTPLGDETLRARLLALATRVGVPAVGVFVADQSRKSRTANAAVLGLGRTRRILLFDTILGFAPREIEAVLAHELGHHVRRDMWRGIAMNAALTLAGFAVAHVVLTAVAAWRGLRGLDDPAGLPWLALVFGTTALLALPLVNGYSRWIERRADDFALRVTGDVEGFVGAMERLAGLNLAERRPHPVKEMLLYSHPAVDRRIARARAAVSPGGAGAGDREGSLSPPHPTRDLPAGDAARRTRTASGGTRAREPRGMPPAPRA